MSVTVKAILQYPEGLELGSSPDVRRFKVDKGTDGQGDLYGRVQDALVTAFPDIQGLDYSLFSKDDDGDMVQMSSMAELQQAIDSNTDKVFKLYVIVNFNNTGDTSTPSSSDSEGEAVAKRVRFKQAGKRMRQRIRRRRKSALDDVVVSQEYRRGVRMVLQLSHRAQKKGGKAADAAPADDQEKATLAALTPEVTAFVQKIADQWHNKLAKKRPRVVHKRVRKENKAKLPEVVDKDQFKWLCRFLGRWHRRHAGKCEVMAGWSSGETGDDTSADEEALVAQLRKRRAVRQQEKKTVGEMGLPAPAPLSAPDTDAAEKSEDDQALKDFRKDTRTLMRQLHRKKKTPAAEEEKTTLAALTPEVRAFIAKMAEEWHTRLAKKRPRVVAKKVKKSQRKVMPAGLEKDRFKWLCRFMLRWHKRNASKCDNMAGWSSGVEALTSEDEEKKAKKKAKKEAKKAAKKGDKKDDKKKDKKKEDKKKDKKKDKNDSSSSSSDSEEEDPVSQEFRKDVRVMVRQLHRKSAAAKTADGDNEADDAQTTVAKLSPEVQTFIKTLADDWHSKLSQKPPSVVARIMQRKEESQNAGLDKFHHRWVCRFMSRWHRRHAEKCTVMAGWSSGETGDDTDGEEDRRRRRRAARKLRRLQAGEISQSEDTDCAETACPPVSKEFRAGVRVAINQLHRHNKKSDAVKGEKPKDDKDKAAPAPLPKEVASFLQTFVVDWHARVSQGKRPRAVSKAMKAEERSLPKGLSKDQHCWLSCYIARWHRKHSDKCEVMPVALPARDSDVEA